MLARVRKMIIFLLPVLGLMTPVAALAADGESEEQVETAVCEISQPALDAINNASAEWVRQGSDNTQAKALIDEAKSAIWPPECDSELAKILADRAMKQLEDSANVSNADENVPTADEPVIDDQPLFTRFDGPWDFGVNAEFIEQDGVRSADFLDSVFDDKYGLHVGKELYRTEKWLLGGQVHIARTNDNDAEDSDEINFDSTGLFATARYESLPALQFKVGLAEVDYENFFDRGSESGLAYGIGLTTGNENVRVHWLDYEVYRVGDEKFEVVSVNLLIVLCIVGVFFGSDCL